MEAYQRSIETVKLYGPTNMAPIINHVANFAEASAAKGDYQVRREGERERERERGREREREREGERERERGRGELLIYSLSRRTITFS